MRQGLIRGDTRAILFAMKPAKKKGDSRKEPSRPEDVTQILDRIYRKEDSSLDPVLAILQTRALSAGDDW
jgi:hypothetical protein